MNLRSSGILLHLSSLPSNHGIGDLGPAAHRFADFLSAAGQRLWQLLPLTPTASAHGHSPYHCPSAFAGNPLLISLHALVADGLLRPSEVATAAVGPDDRVVFHRAARFKGRLLARACDRFADRGDAGAFERFCRRSGWLDDFALFTVLRAHYRRPWHRWPRPLRDREPGALAEARDAFREPIRARKIQQFLFHRQWRALRRHCHRLQVRLMGDMPIYVPADSVDVWAHRQGFQLTRGGRPAAVSGVPPDAFSDTGQLWGHPVYDWRAMAREGYRWWVARMARHLDLYDVTRIDHFRGLVAYWEVPPGAGTAMRGRWAPAPVDDLFRHLVRRLGPLPVIAEDLGTIDAEVRAAMRRWRLPGMRLLLFAFGDDFPDGAFLPHRYPRRCAVYTGTHDNNTVRGWFETEADARTRGNLFRYLGREVPAEKLPWELIRLAMMSRAEMAVFPLQDVLGLGAGARMNHPARRRGNWRWRFAWDALEKGTAERLREMTVVCGRS